uniref:Protein Abitram n=1 Tax=Plectus sambesii TaxID=2011161 RepID=A0A914XEK7_9BILA
MVECAISSHRSSLDRNFTRFSPQDATDEDASFLAHPSGVIVVILSTRHPALAKTINQVDFNVNKKKHRGVDRSQQTVIGKGKKGGLQLLPVTRLCLIKCADGSEYPLRAGVKGTLIEVNDRLLTEPTLMQTSRENKGFIALIMPKGNETKDMVNESDSL